MQIFAAESHAPRSRRTLDIAIVVVGSVLIAGLILISDDRSELEERWFEFASEIPDWIAWFADAVYLTGWIYFLFLIIGLGLVARQRHDLLRDMLVALALPIAVTFLLAQLVSNEWPDLAILMEEGEIADTFPALSVTMITAVHATASPSLSRPLRHFGWAIVLLASFASLVANFLLVRDVMGALLLGWTVAALVHLMFGTPAGRPTLNRIRTAAADLGVTVTDLAYDVVQPPSVTVAEGTDDQGRSLRIMVLGRDAASDDWLNRAWRYAWYHESGSPFGAGRNGNTTVMIDKVAGMINAAPTPITARRAMS